MGLEDAPLCLVAESEQPPRAPTPREGGPQEPGELGAWPRGEGVPVGKDRKAGCVNGCWLWEGDGRAGL